LRCSGNLLPTKSSSKPPPPKRTLSYQFPSDRTGPHTTKPCQRERGDRTKWMRALPGRPAAGGVDVLLGGRASGLLAAGSRLAGAGPARGRQCGQGPVERGQPVGRELDRLLLGVEALGLDRHLMLAGRQVFERQHAGAVADRLAVELPG